MTTKLKLNFIRETEQARLYSDSQGREFWIPRSIVEHTTKWPNGVHEITLPIWKIKEMGF
jgi:hypothetical protein